MKKIFCLIIVLFPIGVCHAQHVVDHRIEIGFQYSLEHVNMLQDGETRDGFGYRLWKYGYTTGIMGKIGVTNHLSFESGYLYSYKGFRMWNTGVERIWELKYTEIPVGLSFNYIASRVHYAVGLALVPGYLNEISQEYQIGAVNYTDELQFKDRLVLGWKAKLGIGYQLNKFAKITVSPQAYYSFWMPADNSYHFISWGIDIGLVYCISKTATF